MADTAAATTMFDVLLPVIVGGGIAIIGGLIGPPFLHHLQQKAEKKRRRAEKFEELIATLYEHHHWLTIVRNVRVFGLGEDRKVMSPIAKVQAISSVYFPEFEDQIRALIAADQYEIWMMTAEQKRLKKDVTFADDAKEVYQPYLQKFHSLLRELREFAMREFQ